MKPVSRHVIATLVAVAAVGMLGVAVFAWSGAYNIAADDGHTRPVSAFLAALRERSIESRASKLSVPALDDAAKVVQGAGNYAAMCAGCHLAPGSNGTELSRGLYPVPPDLSAHAVEPAHAFWVIKHGVKASGMPAWGKSMDDESIWGLAAFLQKLPTLDEAAYGEMVARSGGHAHGSGSAGGADEHPHGAGEMDHHKSFESAGADHAGADTHEGEGEKQAAKPAHRKADGHTHKPGAKPGHKH